MRIKCLGEEYWIWVYSPDGIDPVKLGMGFLGKGHWVDMFWYYVCFGKIGWCGIHSRQANNK